MKMVITGGHLTPALALIDYVKLLHPEDEVVYLGRKFSQEKFKQESIEVDEIAKRPQVQFEYFAAPKLHFDQYWSLPQQLWKLRTAVQEAKQVLKKYQPQVVVSFGGYLALPVTWAAHRLHIPVITHEQTRSAGFANQLIGKFADKVAISFAETANSFPPDKTILTGNLLRPHFHQSVAQVPDWFTTTSKLPMLYITGGSQGSVIINQTIKEILPQLLKDWCVVHQVGKPSQRGNPLQELQAFAQSLPADLREHYFLHEWLSAVDLHWLYEHLTAAAGRAGANTVMELSVHQIPSLFIPLPASRGAEQQKNAQSMSEVGAARILPQSELTPARMLAEITQLAQDHKQMRSKAVALEALYPEDSIEHFYQLISQLVYTDTTQS